jgi:DNA mismatch repair protein MutL
LNHAISQAFTELISKDQFPSYFIYLSVPLDSIDINIHPTKTEINFEDIRSVYAILLSGVKRAIGQYSISPSLDFEQEKALQIRPLRKSDKITYPSIKVNPNYNPFNSQEEKKEAISNNLGMYKETQASFIKDDDTLLEKQANRINVSDSKKYFQYQNKIIITQVKSGLLLIDQKRAHRQILYEDLLKTINQNNKSNSQKLLFPVYIELSVSDYSLCKDILEKMQQIGIDIDDFGNNTLVVNGLPSEIKESECENIIEEFIENFKMNSDKFDNIDNQLAWSYAKSSCIKSGIQLDNIEMETLIGQLFACNSSSIDAKGNVIISKIENMAIDKKFKY